MIIITDSYFAKEILFAGHSSQMEVYEVDFHSVFSALEEEDAFGDHNGRVYCWTGEREVPEEVKGILEFRNMCTEEYVFDSLEARDTIYFYTEIAYEECVRIAYHMATFAEIEK